MKKTKSLFAFLLFCFFSLTTLHLFAAEPPVYVIQVKGVINPVSAKYIVESIEKAEDAKAQCLVLELDTPGGLMTSMRQITQAFLSSKIPILVYVYPQGARAASAGVFITYAAHIAAMAPSTNIGAAHPVTIGGGTPGAPADTSGKSTMMEKVTNDAVASIKSLAEKRHRNAKWAEEAVRKSVSITEKEALALHVIDYIAPTLDSLLALVDGKKVDLDDHSTVLRTRKAPIIREEMNWRYRILDKLSDPNIAYIFLLLGLYGLIFELSNPGSILPGVAGVIFLILAFFAMQTLPINYAGLSLILFGVVLFVLEIKITSYGLLTIGGIISMTLGSLMLFQSPYPFLKVSLGVIVPAVLVTALFFIFAVGAGLKAQTKRSITGTEGLIGETGEALTPLGKQPGKVKVHGEIWKAVSDQPIKKGSTVKVDKVNHLTLHVKHKE
ncbi:MAG: nodulation protein NfeD [Calditrichaeota bacterium]|nr:nodulation protein NfeD [Calditrichota bacterium]